MIVGVFVRHYKVYQGVHYIPLCNADGTRFASLIGDNGTGKSSVLEALNTFFNNGYWNVTKGVKKTEAHIAPIVLIKKSDLLASINVNSKIYNLIEFLSEYFWEVTNEANSNLSKPTYMSFFKQKEELKMRYNKDEYYLLLVGMEYESKSKISFITFNNDLENKRPLELKGFDDGQLLEIIRRYYKYIYIPVQTSSSELLRIEGKVIQELMNSDILEEIDGILNQKIFQNEGNRKKISVIDYLNNSLNIYMEDVNNTIKKIDETYEFKVEGGAKKNLTSNDVRIKILEAYFAIRTLKKDKKEIEELSSGEQRIAIIDIATAFLTNKVHSSEQVIFAIDEPESSLHISKAFNQFERLNKLAKEHQILLTTHWYGSLPITHKGILIYLQRSYTEKNKIEIKGFDFNNYFEGRKYLPRDIMLKGYFELTSSILSSMRADKTNWIICEGTDDKAYIEHYLKEKIENLRVFSVGGCGNVIKIFKYLYVPLSEKEESEEVQSKILCIVDTDDNVISIDGESQTKNKRLRIARLQIDNNEKFELKNMEANGSHFSTEVEDCLKPQILFQAIKNVIQNQGSDSQKEVISYYGLNKTIGTSRIKGEKSIFILEDIKGEGKRHILYNLFNDNQLKYSICKEYIKLDEEDKDNMPPLFKEIIKIFNKN